MKQERERDLALALERHDAETHRKGAEEQKVYRARVVLAFMEAGIPLSKLDCPALRELLEESHFNLAHSRHMMDLVPFVLQEEVSHTKGEVSGKLVSIISDRTTRLWEVLVVLHSRLGGKATSCSRSFPTEKFECRRVSSPDYQCLIYPKALDLRCISHTLDLIGNKFKVPTLILFFTIWISHFFHSAKLKALWRLNRSIDFNIFTDSIVELLGSNESSFHDVWWH